MVKQTALAEPRVARNPIQRKGLQALAGDQLLSGVEDNGAGVGRSCGRGHKYTVWSVYYQRFAKKFKRKYCGSMAEVKKFSFEEPEGILDLEDEETLSAINEGIHDAEAGRTVTAEEVRKLMAQWTTASSTPEER